MIGEGHTLGLLWSDDDACVPINGLLVDPADHTPCRRLELPAAPFHLTLQEVKEEGRKALR
eukprot:1185363-Prorocentrum_minimum.AAC.2